jgi:hypothetical protein
MGGENWICVLHATTGEELRRMRDPVHRVAGAPRLLAGPLTISPDSKLVASAFSNPIIRLWDPLTGKEVCRLRGHEAYLHQIAFFPHGKMVASAAGWETENGFPIDHTNRIWDLTTGRQVWIDTGDKAPFWSTIAPDGRTFADTDAKGKLVVYEMASGKPLLCLSCPGSEDVILTYSPDVQRLLTGQPGGAGLIWDLSPQGWQAPAAKPNAKELQQCWEDLNGEDGPRARCAVYTLAHHGAPALAFLRERLKPIPKDYAERVRQRIADLDSDDFRKRELAVRELTRLGPDAVLPLHAALDAKPSVEAKNRIEALLKDLHPWYIKDPETLRTVRAIWVLQRMATPEARAVLESLAAGAPEARITQEAQAALRFLDRNRKP